MCDNQIPLDKLPYEKIYDDLVHPTAEAVGVIVSLPARYVRQKLSNVEKFILEGEKNLTQISETISEKMSGVNPENVIEPEPYIAVPALQGISYCMDNDELRNLYANLLATAMQKDKKESVLPAFTEIIKQMSPTDAILMKNIKPQKLYPLADARYQDKTPSLFATLPIFKPFTTGSDVFQNLSSLLCDQYTPENIAISIENLARLGLITINSTIVKDESVYNNIALLPCCIEWEERLTLAKAITDFSDEYKDVKKTIQNRELALIPKSFLMTNLGKLFFETCVG